MSESSKEKLLQAAIQNFATCGYEGASTRQIAAAAGVNISAIAYYFGGKRGLYRAVLTCISDAVKGQFLLPAKEAKEKLADPKLSHDELLAIAKKMLSDFTEFLLGDNVPPAIVHILLREQVEPSEDFPLLYEPTIKKMHELLTQAIARLSGLAFPSEEATICAHAIIGQIIVFKTHKAIALHRLKWKKYGEKEIAKIINMVLQNMDRIASGSAKARG